MSLQDKTHGLRGIMPCTKRGTLLSLIPGKLFMKKICLMTMVVAVAVLSRMWAVEALSPAGPNLRERLHSAAGKWSRRLRRMVDDWVAAAIAYREHRVTLFALRNFSDAELRDFGVYRGSPGSAFHRYRDLTTRQ
jgi:hypothetical protein